jgi:hypothetical protein
MDDQKPVAKKTKQQLSEDAEKIIREMMSVEIKKRIVDKADRQDPAVIKTFRFLLAEDEIALRNSKEKQKPKS